MWRYIIFRLIQAAITLFIVMFIVFISVRLVGDPALLMAPPEATPEDIEQIRIQLGLHEPLPVQFYRYISGVLQGDFGMSLRWRIPAFQLWLSRLPNTLLLAIPASIIGFPIGLILGIIGAIKVNRWPDNLSRLFAFIGMSMPQFWVAIMLVMGSDNACDGLRRPVGLVSYLRHRGRAIYGPATVHDAHRWHGWLNPFHPYMYAGSAG